MLVLGQGGTEKSTLISTITEMFYEELLAKCTTTGMEARFATASMNDNLKKTGKLRGVLEIAVGMKAMVLLNLAVEATSETEPEALSRKLFWTTAKAMEVEDGAIHLKFPPTMILF